MPQTKDIVDLAGITNLAGILEARVARSPDAAAYRQHDADGTGWSTSTWAEFAAEVCRWQAALRAENLEPGERVAIMLGNRREWAAYDMAALGLGLVTVPLYINDRPENMGLDASSYKLGMRAYAGPQRFLEDTLHARPWLAYRLRIPGGELGSSELLKVVLALGDGVARDTISHLFEQGEDAWSRNAPPVDANPSAMAEWQRLRELIHEGRTYQDSRLRLSADQESYQTLVRSCATLARYAVLTATKRMIHGGFTEGVDQSKVAEPVMEKATEWMGAIAHTNLWGLFVRAPLALAYVVRHPESVPDKIPDELAAAGLVEKRDGKAWLVKYAHHGKSPYDRSGMHGRDYAR